jgi:DNA-binding PadR family transcriptional regulator
MDDHLRVFFARSKLRVKVLQSLSEKDQVASFLAKKLGKHRETISRIFRDLQEQGFIECANPDSPNFRFYRITPKGKRVLKKI